MRRSRNRIRYLPTVARVSCRRWAIALLGSPVAAARTIRARVTIAAGIERERAIEVNCDRSSSLNTNSAFGRPIDVLVSPAPLIPTSYVNIGQLTTEWSIVLSHAPLVCVRIDGKRAREAFVFRSSAGLSHAQRKRPLTTPSSRYGHNGKAVERVSALPRASRGYSGKADVEDTLFLNRKLMLANTL
jgi:hypothetical protein